MHSEHILDSAARLEPAFEAGAHTTSGAPSSGWWRVTDRVVRPWRSVPLRYRLVGVAALGVLGATAVASVTAENPGASPAHLAVVLRVLIIGTLIGAGMYAQTSTIQAPMGGLLVAAGLYSSVWLLNGSRDPLLFALGATAGAGAQVMVVFLCLAHPSGRLHSSEARYLLVGGALVAGLWAVLIALTGQPPVKTGMVQCAPHCPPAPWSLGVSTNAVAGLSWLLALGWAAFVAGGALLMVRRVRSAAAPARASVIPVAVVAVLFALLVLLHLVALAAGLTLQRALGAAFVECVLAVPLAILIGLIWERMLVGRELAHFVTQLALMPEADPQVLLAEALGDPSLRIAYRRPSRGVYVDSSGSEVTPVTDDQVVAWIERRGNPVAAVMFSRELADQSEFVTAAAAAALMRIEKAQAEADLKASRAALSASRARLVESAQVERRRLERDLHDGVQQQVVALRVRIGLAAETIEDDPGEAGRALAVIGARVDDLLKELRSLARGIYPALLQARGLGDALRSAADNTPLPVVVRALGVGRYAQSAEVAVYFCCLEALQNVMKHGGPDAQATVTLWETRGQLCFEVRDSGVGFDPAEATGGNGLTNMRDRIEATGGTLSVTSRPAGGTVLRGVVPVE